jgi:thioredoxin 1
MLPLILSAMVGAGIGAALGHFGKCAGGTCPLTSTWWRGALYGAVLGGAFYFVSGRGNSAAMNESSPNVTRVNADQFEAEVIQSKSPVVVDFYATWCGPCKRLAPIMEELAAQFSGKIKFVKINIDQAPAIAQTFRVEGLPTILFFDNGAAVDTLVGLPAAGALKSRIESLANRGQTGAGKAPGQPL